ncbi:MAG TPA: mechanosensitive ion channel domain-containing protein [Gaiellaceae bacterium]|nr:mechanosensitive ion channel domain-containing protein [Gaiellaceae bacterium]
MPFWERATIAAVVVLAAIVLAKAADVAMRRVQLRAGAETRYRVLRRAVMAVIVFVAVFSALLVFPQVRAIAGALLASGAVIGIVVGFASQRTIGNFVAGILIAATQPLRIGDRVTVSGVEGVVEEITLTYTFIRADDDSRLVVPNEKLASDTIQNATIVRRAQRAEITLQVPLSSDLETVIGVLGDEVADQREPEVFVSGLAADATVTIRVQADDPSRAERLQQDLRLRAQRRLRAAGIYA